MMPAKRKYGGRALERVVCPNCSATVWVSNTDNLLALWEGSPHFFSCGTCGARLSFTQKSQRLQIAMAAVLFVGFLSFLFVYLFWGNAAGGVALLTTFVVSAWLLFQFSRVPRVEVH